MIFEWIISIILVLVFMFAVVSFVYVERQSKKYKYGEHFCNHCKRAYILTDEDLSRTHCDKCGRKLTRHELDPDLYELDDEENEENGNEENPFPDM